MTKKHHKTDSPVGALKSESARQRWELFHRAIAHAKESNNASLAEVDSHSADAEAVGPLLSIVR
jgi:hypothetical protein